MNRRPCPGSAAAFVVVAAACLAAPASVAGQSAAPAPARRVLVMPFENVNREGKIFWLSEASAVLLTEDLDARGGQAISRDERLRAFDRLQLPASAATCRIAPAASCCGRSTGCNCPRRLCSARRR